MYAWIDKEEDIQEIIEDFQIIVDNLKTTPQAVNPDDWNNYLKIIWKNAAGVIFLLTGLCLFITPYSQEMDSPANPGRFIVSHDHSVSKFSQSISVSVIITFSSHCSKG